MTDDAALCEISYFADQFYVNNVKTNETASIDL